jgi:hypothetical protein
MPRYLVERTFNTDFNLPSPESSEHDRLLFIKNNAIFGVVWIYSLVSPDKKKSYCIYDAPSPETLRQAAISNSVPVDRITEVRLLELNHHDSP